MANTKTSALPVLTGAGTAVGDLIPIDDISTVTLKQISISELITALVTLGNLTTDSELSTGLSGKQDAATAATDAELTAHTGAAVGAHAASAISIADAGNDFTATTVEGALDELQADAETTAGQLFTHITVATDAHDASMISVLDTAGHYAGANVEVVLDEVGDIIEIAYNDITSHIADSTGAHAGTAISNAPAGGIAATTVQAAINELDTEKLSLLAGGASVENIGAIESNVETTNVATTKTADTAVYGVFDYTMTAVTTFTFSNPAPSGKNSTFVLILRGAFTPTLPASVKWNGGTPPTYTTPSIYTFTTVDAGTNWYGSQMGKAFA